MPPSFEKDMAVFDNPNFPFIHGEVENHKIPEPQVVDVSEDEDSEDEVPVFRPPQPQNIPQQP